MSPAFDPGAPCRFTSEGQERLEAFVDGGITLPILTMITPPDNAGELIEALAPPS